METPCLHSAENRLWLKEMEIIVVLLRIAIAADCDTQVVRIWESCQAGQKLNNAPPIEHTMHKNGIIVPQNIAVVLV